MARMARIARSEGVRMTGGRMARIAKITARKAKMRARMARMTGENDRGLYTAASPPHQYPTYHKA